MKKALLWFIHRFIHHKAGKRFALRIHGFDTDMTDNQRYKLTNSVRRAAFARFDFHLEKSIIYPNSWKVIPNNAQAAWAHGYIQIEHGSYTFSSANRDDLFENLDKAEEEGDHAIQ